MSHRTQDCSASWSKFRFPWPGAADTFALPRGRVVNFTDSQLQDCYERNFAALTDLSAELREGRALIAAHDLVQMLEGPPCSGVHGRSRSTAFIPPSSHAHTARPSF